MPITPPRGVQCSSLGTQPIPNQTPPPILRLLSRLKPAKLRSRFQLVSPDEVRCVCLFLCPHGPHSRDMNGVTRLLRLFSGIHSPDLVERPMSVPFPVQLRFPFPHHRGLTESRDGQGISQHLPPDCSCSLQRARGLLCGPLIAPPETGFLRQAPGPANCLPPPVPPGPTTSAARLHALQALSLRPELCSFSGPEVEPHLGAGLLFQTRKYKAFIH